MYVCNVNATENGMRFIMLFFK